MAEIASMFVRVGANVDNFNRGMNQVESRVGGFQRTMQGMGNAIGTTMKVVGAASGLAVAGLGVAVAKTGVEFNALKEQADIAFTTMLGSGEKAKTFLDELQRFAAKTPFEFPDLLQSSQRLLAMGFAAEEVMPVMTSIGDAVAALGGNAETINRVTTAFGQMNAKGKTSAEEMMQLTEAGIPAWEFLAKKIGVDIPGAMAMVTKGMVSADTTIAAVTEGINQRFGGMMEKQSGTFNGLVSTLKDTFTMVSGRVMAPFFKMMQKGLGWLVDFTTSPEFTAGIDRFVERITNGFAFVGDAVKRFKNTFGLNLAVITSGNASWGEKMLAVWDMLYTVGLKIWQALLDGIKKLVPEWLAGLWEWAKGLWQWIVDATPEALAKLGEWAKALWGWLVDNLPTWAANLWEWAKATWQWIVDVTPEAVTQLGLWGAALWDWLVANAPTWAANLAKWGVLAWQWIVDTTPIVVEKLGAWATALWQWLVEVTPTVVAKLREWGKALWNWLTTNLPVWRDNLAAWGKAAWEWLAAAIPTLLAKLGQFGSTLWGWLVDNGPNWIGAFDEWARAAWAWLSDAFGPIVSWLGKIAAEFISWKDIVIGSAIALGILFAPAIIGALAAVAAPIVAFVAAWAPVLALFAAAIVAVSLVRNAWERDWGGIRTTTLDALEVLRDAFAPLLETIREFGGDALKEIIAWATGNKTNFEATKKIWEAAKTAFGTVFDAIVDKLTEWGNAAWEWFSNKFPGAAKTMIAAVESIKENWQEFWNALSPLIQRMRDEFDRFRENWLKNSGDITTGIGKLQKFLDSAWTIIVSVAALAINNMINVLTLFVQMINGDWMGAWETMKEIAENTWDTVVTVVREAIKGILALFGVNIRDVEKWISDVGAKLREAATRFREWGRNLIEGLKDGVEEKWRSFKSWLEGIWRQLTRTFTLKFDTHSPSGLFKEYGGDLMQGLALGIRRGAGLVYDAMDGLNTGTLQTGVAGLGAGGVAAAAPAVSTSRIEELLVILIQELRAKNLTANVSVGGGGSYGDLVTHLDGMRR